MLEDIRAFNAAKAKKEEAFPADGPVSLLDGSVCLRRIV